MPNIGRCLRASILSQNRFSEALVIARLALRHRLAIACSIDGCSSLAANEILIGVRFSDARYTFLSMAKLRR
jgi:hypothetical protein